MLIVAAVCLMVIATLRCIWRSFRRNPWGWWYLACIPIFTFAYMVYSDEFHDSNIQFESSFAQRHESLVNALSYDYSRLNQLPRNVVDGPKGPALIEDAHVQDVNADATGVRMLIAGELEPSTRRNSPDPFEEYVVLGGADYNPLIANAYGGNSVEIQVTPYSGADRLVNQLDIPTENLVPDDRLLVDYQTLDLIDNYRQAATGDPSPEGSSFPRFLYLSAITITTLGFGDITPVSTRARLLVAIEAVLGVAFAGLFLNRVARPKNDDTRDSAWGPAGSSTPL